MTVDWTMLVMILVIRIIIVFIPITTESSSTLFCRIIKVDWMIIRIIVFFSPASSLIGTHLMDDLL